MIFRVILKNMAEEWREKRSRESEGFLVSKVTMKRSELCTVRRWTTRGEHTQLAHHTGIQHHPLQWQQLGNNNARRESWHCRISSFLILLFAMWTALTGIGIHAVTNGDYRLVVYPLDYDGNICGTDFAEDMVRTYCNGNGNGIIIETA
jgi:hypothetical protein